MQMLLVNVAGVFPYKDCIGLGPVSYHDPCKISKTNKKIGNKKTWWKVVGTFLGISLIRGL